MWKLKGYTVDAFEQTQVVYNIWANTKNDLPSTMTDIGYGTALGFGSTAQTFDDSKEWRWNGTQWVEQTDGSGGGGASSADQVSYDNTDSGLTATNVQDAIDEIKDLDDMQDRALAELYGDDANQQLEINYSINTGSKNKLENTVAVGTQTIRTVDVIVNADGSVDIGPGTVTGGNLDLHINTSAGAGMVNGGSYILSGCPQGGSASTYRLNCTGIGYETGEGKEFVYNGGALDVYLRVYSGQTISTPLHFAPMIRDAVIRDSTFEPYAPTNRELYETEQRQDSVIADKWGYIRGTIGGTGDFNMVVSSGYYRYNGAPANAPTGANGEFGVLMVYAAGSYISQIAHCFLSSKYGIYIRSSTNTGSTWTAWLKLEGTQAASTQSAPASLMQAGQIDPTSTLNLDRNDLNEQLDTNFDLIDSIPEEEEGEEDV